MEKLVDIFEGVTQDKDKLIERATQLYTSHIHELF